MRRTRAPDAVGTAGVEPLLLRQSELQSEGARAELIKSDPDLFSSRGRGICCGVYSALRLSW